MAKKTIKRPKSESLAESRKTRAYSGGWENGFETVENMTSKERSRSRSEILTDVKKRLAEYGPKDPKQLKGYMLGVVDGAREALDHPASDGDGGVIYRPVSPVGLMVTLGAVALLGYALVRGS